MIFELLHTNEPGHTCSHLLYSFKIEEQKKNGYAKIKIIKSQIIKNGEYTSRDEDYVMEELARYSQKNKKLDIKNYSAKNDIHLSYYSKPCTTTCMPFKLNPGDRLDFEFREEVSDLRELVKHQPPASSSEEQATHSGQEQQDCMKTSADQGHSKAPEPTRLICI
jgi:hypothetical protein